MGLSSNILWHQTDFKTLKKIIRSKHLVCSYSLETFLDREHKLAFPMISLSDIPVADINEYMGQYGGCLIGFSRGWVIENGFNPVWYCEKNNQALKEHKKQLYRTFNIDANNKSANKLTWLALQYGAYIKDIEGPLHVKSKNVTYANYRFYDEREYRYVPDFMTLLNKEIQPALFEEDYCKYKKEKGNGLIDHSVPFSFNDIKMLIVKTDNQVTEIKKLLQHENHTIHVFTHDEINQSIIGVHHQLVTEKK